MSIADIKSSVLSFVDTVDDDVKEDLQHFVNILDDKQAAKDAAEKLNAEIESARVLLTLKGFKIIEPESVVADTSIHGTTVQI